MCRSYCLRLDRKPISNNIDAFTPLNSENDTRFPCPSDLTHYNVLCHAFDEVEKCDTSQGKMRRRKALIPKPVYSAGMCKNRFNI